jgi:CheY-like chemotaxis protein
MSQQEAPGGQRPLVLVVDDQPAVLHVLVRSLAHHGFSGCLATSGRQALELFRTHQEAIRIALIDQHMPGMDGVETMQALLQLKPSLRCAIITGIPDEDEVLRAAGALCVLTKPFHMEVLGKTLRSLLEGDLAVCRDAC